MNQLDTAGNNSLLNKSLYIFIIRFFPVLANVVVFIYYGHTLDPTVNGKYINFWAQLPLLTAVACLGIQVLMPTYTAPVIVTLFKKINRTHFTLYAIWIFSVAFLFAAMQVYSGFAGFTIAFIFLISNALSVIAESFLIVCRRFLWTAAINTAYAISFCFLHWFVLSCRMPLQSLFPLLLLICVLRLLLFLVMAIRDINKMPEAENHDIPFADSRSLWLHMMFYDISQQAFKWVDKILISLIFAASVSAVYFYGAYDIPFLPLVLYAVGSATLINIAENNNDDIHTAKLMRQSIHVLSAVVFPLFFFLLFFRYEIFEIVFTKKYEGSVPIFLATLLVVPLRACNFTVVLQNRHQGRIINTGAILDLLLACVLIYPFYLLWGLPGIAFTFTFTTYLQSSYYLYHTAKLLNVRLVSLLPYKNLLIKFMAFGLLFMACHYFAIPVLGNTGALVSAGLLLIASVLGTLGFEHKYR